MKEKWTEYVAVLPNRSNIKYCTVYIHRNDNNNMGIAEQCRGCFKFVWNKCSIETKSNYNCLIVIDSFVILIKLKVIGHLEKLAPSLQQKIKAAVESTKNNSEATVCIAFSYGSRAEIVDAFTKAIDSGITKITEDNFRNFLYDPEMPDVDLLIRTGNDYRISNFLLWQLAYAELYFLDKFWPEFDVSDLEKSIGNYSTRQRNFGGR